MAVVSFSANDLNIDNQGLNGSGLGFFGSSFGASIDVGDYQDSTWITDGQGLSQGPQINNVKYVHPASGSINGLDPVSLINIPNYLSTLKITFNHGSAIKTQNAKFRCYDRVNIDNPPSGILCQAVEIVHPSTSQAGDLGSGNASWSSLTGSGNVLSMTASPGLSGERPNGLDTTSTQHDWYIAISQSPNSVGDKTTAGYFSVEYL